MRVLLILCTLLLIQWPATAGAHEIGKTQVQATFDHSGTYRLDVVVDPDALLTRLQILATGQVTPVPDRQARDTAIIQLLPALLGAVQVRFDGAADRPTAEYRPPSAIGELVQTPGEVRLTGHVPTQARAFEFAYALAGGTYALVAHVRDSTAQTFWIEGPASSGAIPLAAPPPPPTRSEVAVRYLALGFTHILPKGLDHILFVVGLFLLSTRWRSVLLQVSAFTLAHSITLGLTIYGVVSLPARVVEPMIALSIAYVAVENLITSELKSWRVALVFAFGLLHGMGFAGVLRDLGLPRTEFLTALITFNLGVEAGQLTVVALAFALVAHWRRNVVSYRRYVTQPVSVAIAFAGLYWTYERLL